MVSGARTLEWLQRAVLGVFVAALLAGIFLPLYTDEIGWRLQERAGLDGVDKVFTEVCGPNTVVRPPFWMMPVRYYSALFNTLFADPIYVRISGILYALVWTGLLLKLIGRASDSAPARTRLSLLALGYMSLGTMPLLLVWSRPEQPILLAFTGAILIALGGQARPGDDTPATTAWRRSIAIGLLALLAMSYHVKAVAAMPLFLACLFMAARGRAALLPRLLVGAIMLVAAIWAAQYWVDRFACPGSASVRASALNSPGAAIIGAGARPDIFLALTRLFDNLSLYVYPGLTAPRPQPMSSWLPPGRIGDQASFAWFVATVAVWTPAFAAAGYCLLCAARRAWRERRLDARAVLAVFLIVTALGWSALGFVAVYEASFALPMLVIAIVLSLATHRDERTSLGTRFAAMVVGAAGVVSIALIAILYGPSLLAATRDRGYAMNDTATVSSFGYASVRRDALAAARQCGIGDPAGARALVLDDVTYFAFMRSHMPEHRGGLFSPLVSHRDPIAYLRSVGSDGMIVSCDGLPADFRARSRRHGRFCCMAPPNW